MSDEPTDEERAGATDAWWERMAVAGHSFEEGRTVLQDGRWVAPEEVDMGRPWWTLGSETHPSTYVEPSPLPEGWQEVGYTTDDASASGYHRHTEPPLPELPGPSIDGPLIAGWVRAHVEFDLQSWQAEHLAAVYGVRRPASLPPALSAESAGFIQGIGAAVRGAGELLQPVIDEWGGYAHGLLDTLTAAGLLDERPPTDPRERALWMRRHRSTGPAKPPPGARQNRR